MFVFATDRNTLVHICFNLDICYIMTNEFFLQISFYLMYLSVVYGGLNVCLNPGLS
jgi:hypothetical protein